MMIVGITYRMMLVIPLLLISLFIGGAAGQGFLLDLPWTMEGGNEHRESAVSYDGAADSAARARYFYYSLNEGAMGCYKSQPGTASGTPVSWNGVWIVGTCNNELVGFASAEKLSSMGGPLSKLWTLQIPTSTGQTEPRFTTPVIL
jgi:hypothetical protein